MMNSAKPVHKSKPVLAIGCAVWDTIFNVSEIPGRGIKLLPKSAKQIASGMAATAAASMARLGLPVQLWCMVGDDMTSKMLLDELRGEGVDISKAVTVKGAMTAFSSILIDPQGERLVVPYFDPTLKAELSVLPMKEVATASAVLADIRWPDAAQAAFIEARKCNVPTVLDADTGAADILWRLCPLADHVLFSEPALLSLVDTKEPREALLQIAKKLPAAKVIGVTLGERGSLMWQAGTNREGDLLFVPAVPIQSVDTLGAGDVWHAAYCYGLVNNSGLQKTVEFANTAAAIKCERLWGRLGAPTLEEVQARLKTVTAFRA
jgi:sulfofructose kinase